MLFDTENIELLDLKGGIVEYLGSNIICPFRPIIKKRTYNESIGKIQYSALDNYPKKQNQNQLIIYNINKFQMESTINILKKDTNYGDKIKKLIYKGAKIIQTKEDFKEDKIYIGKLLNGPKLFITYFSKSCDSMISKIIDNPEENINYKGKIHNIYDEYEVFNE